MQSVWREANPDDDRSNGSRKDCQEDETDETHDISEGLKRRFRK